MALKDKNPNLKVSLSIGGSSFDITKMTIILRSATNRSRFVLNSIDFLRARGFDGLDLDFQYPGSGASPPVDKYRFTLLLQVKNIKCFKTCQVDFVEISEICS